MNALLPFAFESSRKLSGGAYNVEISQAGQGRYKARCRETGLEVTSANAEHDICHALTVLGWPDGAVKFWRDARPSLWHLSIHRMGGYRISLGEDFPKRAKRRDAPSKISSESVEGSPKNGDLSGGGVHAHGDGRQP